MTITPETFIASMPYGRQKEVPIIEKFGELAVHRPFAEFRDEEVALSKTHYQVSHIKSGMSISGQFMFPKKTDVFKFAKELNAAIPEFKDIRHRGDLTLDIIDRAREITRKHLG